jgi:hypothetical protein
MLPYALVAALSCLPTVPASDPAAALERALSTIDAARIGADIHFVASDELEGRDTPSDGLRIAARFLRARLQRLGWRPGAPDGFLWEYELARNRLDADATAAAFVTERGREALVFGEDWMFSGSNLVDQARETPIVYCGSGGEEDLDGLDLAGKAALVVLAEDGPWWHASRRVRDAGAAGVLWAPAEGQEAAMGERWDEWRTELDEGRVDWPSGHDPADGESDDGPYSSCALSAAAVARLFELAGEDAAPAVGTELPVRFADTRAIDPGSPRVALENVCGFWPGRDPELAREVVLVSAHYDHVGVTGGEIYNGADDNGSGTCALLAVAEALVEYGPMERSVMLMWVSGEEKGLLGSKAWALDPWLPDESRAVCDINIDMVGRNAPEKLLVTPTAEHDAYNGLTRLVERLAPLEGFTDVGSADAYYRRSDHAMFQEHMGLPVCFLFSDVHEDYHRPTDTADKVDTDKVRRVARLVVQMLAGLQDETLDL